VRGDRPFGQRSPDIPKPRSIVSADVSTPPLGWEGVDATLAELRASTSELREFLDRQWDELESLNAQLAERARRLERRERELALKEEELAAELESFKIRGPKKAVHQVNSC
jgi:hypothetical protein